MDQNPKKSCVFGSVTSILPSKTVALDLFFRQHWTLCLGTASPGHENEEELSLL